MRTSAIGLATMPIGRIVSLDAGRATGVWETPLLDLPDGILCLNADASRGEIRVEVLASDGTVMPGRSTKECLAIRGNGHDAAVSWSAGPVASTFVVGTKARLRFHLTDAKLYGFRFR